MCVCMIPIDLEPLLNLNPTSRMYVTLLCISRQAGLKMCALISVCGKICAQVKMMQRRHFMSSLSFSKWDQIK